MRESAALNRPANLENSAVATGLEKVSFIPVPKKGNAKECSDYHTITLISLASKDMLKILQVMTLSYLQLYKRKKKIAIPQATYTSISKVLKTSG